MQTHQAKRVEITIELVMQRRLTEAMVKAGVTGYTILPVLGGAGDSGEWSRAGQVSAANSMIQVNCIVSPDRLDALLKAAFEVVEHHIGVLSITDCQVVRAERF